MARKKLQRFEEINQLPNLSQVDQADCQKRLTKFLGDDKPTILELACGRGDYAIALAKKNTNKNFIGIDIQGERLWYGAKQALENKLDNIFFLRIQIENLLEYFGNNSIEEIWITFPDPFPKKGQIKKRLTSLRFLEIYKKILKPGGTLHLKTDDRPLFDYSIKEVNSFGGKILTNMPDIYSRPHNRLLDIQTHYEKMHLKEGKTINYLKFSLK